MDSAAETLQAALDLLDPDVVPTRWANTQHALGVALQEAGHMLRDRERLKSALAAFAEALSLRGRETEPGPHAATRRKIGETYVRLFPMTQNPEALDHALENFEAARDAFAAVGDKARAGEMTEHIRRVRAVHRGPPREVATPTFGRAAAG
jgi:hypothetical protein